MKGRTVLYTGAAGGLGLDTTLLLIERGAHVIALDNDDAKIARLSAAAAKGAGTAHGLAHRSVRSRRAAHHPGRSGAGARRHRRRHQQRRDLPSKPFEDYTIEEHQRVQRINVDAGIVAVQAALPGMRAKGFGRIVNVSSITISGGWANLSPYVASKAALVGLTRAWAREFGEWGVTVNAIAPGAFPTDAETIHPDPEGYNRMVLDAQAIKRRGTASDIAHAIAFFAADEAGFITGQTLHVNGGWTMS
ncbi:SDR family NAD(P)-dependent oxidoreductase [Novosphingobium resinovorum]